MEVRGIPLKGGVQEKPEPCKLTPFDAKNQWFYA